MESIPAILPKKVQDFFKKIEESLDNKLYFYGSVTRSDYVPDKSDIDVAIFSNNEYSDMSKLQHILVVKKEDFIKIIWKLNGNIIYGYKIKVKKLNCEISIFNNDFKEILVEEYTRPNKNTSIFIFLMIYLLKLFYYQIPIIPKKNYIETKRYIMNNLICYKKESIYILLQKNGKPHDNKQHDNNKLNRN
jgi:predicted nucleotidyltransferase